MNIQCISLCLVVFATRCLGSESGANHNIFENSKTSQTNAAAVHYDSSLKLMLEEANVVADELNLPEKLPIRESDLVSKYVPTFQLSQRLKTAGTLTTSNYTYCFSVEKKFSFLTQANLERDYAQLRKDYLWPISSMDTNGAYELATHWLSKVSVDVKALNRDCIVKIDAFIPDGGSGDHFVPLYWVYWIKRESLSPGPVACIELFHPKRSLRQLRVNRAEYILRRAIEN
jgi:hypothetical protein